MGRRDILLAFLDSLLSGLIFAPLAVAYWRGTWVLMDIYLFPNNMEYSAWSSAAIGGPALLIFGLISHQLTEYFQGIRWSLWLVVNHIYTYVFGFIIVNLWRGVWLLWDHYTGTGILSSALSMAGGWVTMALLRTSINAFAPPVVISQDTGPAFFQCTTRFKTNLSDREKYLLDHLFTHCLMASLIVFYWRGLWSLADNLLFPESLEVSAWWSLGIGYCLYCLCVLLQWPMKCVSGRLERWFLVKVAAEDIFHFFTNSSAVLIWRGCWLSCNIYIWPDNLTNSCLLTHGVGLGVLMLLLSGNSVLVRGCMVDGEQDEGQGMLLNNRYLRYYLEKGKQKNETKEKKTEQKWVLKQNGVYNKRDFAKIYTVTLDVMKL